MIEDPAGATLLPRPFGPERNHGRGRHGARHAQHLEDVFDGIVQDERGTVERDRALQRGHRRGEQGIPVETGDDGIVDGEEHALALLRGSELRSPGLHGALQVLGQRSELADNTLELDLGHRGRRENSENPDLLLRPVVGLPVHDAERPEGISLGGDQRDPSVRDHLDVGGADALPEKWIPTGVRNDEWLARSNDMLAEGVRQRRLPQGRERLGQPALTLEELPIAVHARRQARQPIEGLLGRGIQERRPPQCLEASLVRDDVGQLALREGARPAHSRVRTPVLHMTGASPQLPPAFAGSSTNMYSC